MLAVKDLLNRSSFQEAEIQAGNKGLNRKVTWVHVIEIDNFAHLLNGQEIILTTGIKWVNNEEKSIQFLQQLLEQKSSALCVELAEDSKTLPEEMLNMAEKYNFPIIVFNKEVKFIDITRDLHEIILKEQENFQWDLGDLHEDLHKTLVFNYPVGNFLKLLHQKINKQILLKQNEEQFRFFPSPSERKQKQWREQIKRESIPSQAFPINLLGKEIAQLFIIESKDKVSIFDEEAAKRCVEFIEQYFWKHHQTREIEQIKENDWLLEALNGTLTNKQLTDELYQRDPQIKLNDAVVGVIPKNHDFMSENKSNGYVMTETLMLLRSVLERNGFSLFTTEDKTKNEYVLLLINQQGNDSLYECLNHSIQQFYNSNFYNSLSLVSFGKIVSSYEYLWLSYQTAQTTLNYQLKHGTLAKPLYERLGIYRLIDQIEATDELQSIINNYIGALMSYDQHNGTELLKTLQLYLKNMGSKKDTSRELYIVRQTLYHRLDRIKELLGDDFMSADNRVMTELSIYILKYLEGTD